MNHQNVVDTPQAVLSQSTVTLRLEWRRIAIGIAVALFVISAARGAFASQLVVNSTGGTATLGSDFTLTGASVSSPAGTMSLDCPITSVASGTYAITYYCSGGSFTYQSSDDTTSVAAPFGTAS